MFAVERRDGPIPTLLLSDTEAASTAVLAPPRGGMVIQLSLAGRELLFLDRATFEDPIANVRGGVPVLFPTPGKLVADGWSWGGSHGSLRQHGFARNLPWEIAATGTDAVAMGTSPPNPGAWATLRLDGGPATLPAFPWDFRAEITYRLKGRALALEISVENRSASAMPFGFGFHPYFAVRDADKGRVRIPTAATRAFDNANKQDVAFTAFDLTAAEVDLHLLDHGATAASLTLDDLSIDLRGSADFEHWVVWTLRGRDFVCLEPWTCPGNALNTGEKLIRLSRGETRRMSLSIGRA
jgi:galactose mutarotase-like enzyme